MIKYFLSINHIKQECILVMVGLFSRWFESESRVDFVEGFLLRRELW